MKRAIWKKAKENRPSIYDKSKRQTPRRFELDEFHRFFQRFVYEERPEHPMDVQELHRCYARLRTMESDLCDVNVVEGSNEKEVPLDRLLMDALIMRDALVCAGFNEELTMGRIADKIADKSFEKRLPLDVMRGERFWDDVFMGFIGDVAVMAFEMPPDDMEKVPDSIKETMRRCLIGNRQPRKGIRHDFTISQPVLEGLVSFIRRKFRTRFLNYPEQNCRPVAILGDSTDNSIFEQGCCFEGSRTGSSHGITMTPEHNVVLISYPWEASLIDKAKELQARGMPITQPVGNIIVDEVEFVAFGWVPGPSLHGLENEEAWEEYGALIRRCCERGIMMDDAAGRNAILSDEGVTLIDFEHMSFTKKAQPLEEEDRQSALSRVREELKLLELPAMLEAFMRGYDSG